jgi:hypothetical protein
VSSERVSLRQAAVVLPISSETLAAAVGARDDRLTLLRAAVLDVIGALVRVDGVSISIVAPVAEVELGLLAELPAGIEVIAPESGADLSRTPEQHLSGALRATLERRFDRVVAVAGDVVRLTPRAVATALSALGGADLVVGPTLGGSGYLVGVRDLRGVELLAGPGGGAPFGGSALVALATGRRLTLRQLEPLPRVTELPSRTALGAAIARDPALAPRLAAWLKEREGVPVR